MIQYHQLRYAGQSRKTRNISEYGEDSHYSFYPCKTKLFSVSCYDLVLQGRRQLLPINRLFMKVQTRSWDKFAVFSPCHLRSTFVWTKENENPVFFLWK